MKNKIKNDIAHNRRHENESIDGNCLLEVIRVLQRLLAVAVEELKTNILESLRYKILEFALQETVSSAIDTRYPLH
ncbi:hypothetical protein BDR07DRAFT_1409336 [Suillus spraguei]|nr:hypothetical protein BDR07DRAFT_1409336 [Suillus spraguei]